MSTNIQEQIKKLLEVTAGKISNITSVEFIKEGEQLRVSLLTENNDIFLENHSEVLNAVQHFIRKIIHLKNPTDRSHFFLDIGFHNKNREYILSLKVPEFAQEIVILKGRPIIFIGLNSFERLYVHNILVDVNGLQTTSVGIDPNRKLLVLPTSEIGSSSLDDSLIFDIKSIENNNIIDMFKEQSPLLTKGSHPAQEKFGN
jgi:spoIIIJ-associated protein